MNAESWINKVVTAYLPGSCPRGVPKPRSAIVGVVVSVAPLPPSEPGSVPTAALTIRGRSGKELVVSITDHYCSPFPTWAEAIKASES